MTALATVIATVLLIPEAAEVISQLILLAWAAGESTVDLRTLLSGRRAPVLADPEKRRELAAPAVVPPDARKQCTAAVRKRYGGRDLL